MNMERVGTLLDKLQQQFQQKAPPAELLLTLHMMQQELAALSPSALPDTMGRSVVLSMPAAPFLSAGTNPSSSAPPPIPAIAINEEEKIVEVLQVDEAEIEAELDALKKNAEAIEQMSLSSRPTTLFDFTDDDIPTLPPQPASQREVNESIREESPSVNEKLKAPQKEVSEKLNDQTIKDLKKGIDVNERFLYINELFRGDESTYERSIKTINSFSIWPEAEYWISRELKIKLGWDDKNPVVQQFYQLVRRRFAAN
jgi:hypothetical protein